LLTGYRDEAPVGIADRFARFRQTPHRDVTFDGQMLYDPLVESYISAD
jgi:hypothetical protein